MDNRDEHAAYLTRLHQALDSAVGRFGFDAEYHELRLNQYGIVARSRALTPAEQEAETAIRALACLESLAG